MKDMLSNSHKRAIFFAFLDIHRHMAEVEAMMTRDQTTRFDTHANDLSPDEVERAHDSFRRLRKVMQNCLQESQISIENKPASVSWALQCCMSSIGIAVSEISPARLRAYGPLDSAAEVRVLEIQESLRRVLAELKTSGDQSRPQASDSAAAAGADAGDIDGD
jgi:hypothetical protein